MLRISKYRSKIRLRRDVKSKSEIVHTMNSSGLVLRSDRNNYSAIFQQEAGSVVISIKNTNRNQSIMLRKDFDVSYLYYLINYRMPFSPTLMVSRHPIFYLGLLSILILSFFDKKNNSNCP